jgi:hypothetical protein
MTAIKLTQKVTDGGIFIPLKGFDNQLIEIEININAISEIEKGKTAALIAESFFSKIDKKLTVNFDELNAYEQ